MAIFSANLEKWKEKIKTNQEYLLILDDCPKLIDTQNRLLSKQAKFLEFQDVYWKTKAKSDHIELIDANANASYYHACATIRKNRNFISSIKGSFNKQITAT